MYEHAIAMRAVPVVDNVEGHQLSRDNPTPIYRGKIIDVDIEPVILPDGTAFELEIVRHPGGAAAVAIDDRDRVCLLRQYRYVARDWLWELPAGKLDPGEPPLATARRELAEEAGVTARDWVALGREISSPGVFTEVIHLYLARGLEINPTAHEQHEVIEVHWIPFSEALEWATHGEILDAKTLVGLYRAREALRTAPDPQDRPG